MTSPNFEHLDYEHLEVVSVDDASELAQLFRDQEPGDRLRLLGSGSRQHRLPPPPRGTKLVSLRNLNRIERLEAPDLTCSVGPGCSRDELDAELDRCSLELPCPGTGTLGGLLAADPFGPMAPGATTPRTVLLGFDALLAEGLPFKAGARVVKNVAGFDLPKLFVGSRGKLFAATLLHLKLRPKPRAAVCFRQEGLDADAALSLFGTLRLLPVPPAHLALERRNGAFAVHGEWKGRARFVCSRLDRFALTETPHQVPLELDSGGDAETVSGFLRVSSLPRFLASLPDTAPVLVHGGGRFEVALKSIEADGLLAALPQLPACAELVGGTPERRGRRTPEDPAAGELGVKIKSALDPKGVLA